jgi:hypothetical protein
MHGEPIGRDTTVMRSVVDRVTVYWAADTPRRIGNLNFRTGRADETFAETGINHLVEHLTMYGIGRPAYPVNASVDHIRTMFHANAREAEVVTFLGDVGTRLHELPVERVADEARILRTESMGQTPNLPLQLLWYRYGARGFGMGGLAEYGLGKVDPAALAAWTTARFTAGNATAWYSGTPPDDLRFHLPDGPRIPTPPRIPIDPLPLPCWATMRFPGIALGLLVNRSSPSAMGTRILTKRLEQRLRYEMGRSYEVSLAYVPLDAEVAQASIYASCQAADFGEVRDAFIEEVDRLASNGPTQDELDLDVDAFDRHADDPNRVLGELDAAAHNDLVGHPVQSFADLMDEMRQTETTDVRSELATAIGASIICGGLDEPPTRGSGIAWNRYPIWSVTAVNGRRFDPVDRRYPWSPRIEQLVIGPDGASWLNKDGQALTVRFGSCVGVVAEGDSRILYGEDGFSVRVTAAYWRNGATAVDLIDAAIAPELVVTIAASGS